MNEAAFKRLIDTNERITRGVTYQDFTKEQLKELKKLYLTKRYLNVAETALILKVHYNTVYKLISEGKVIVWVDNNYVKPLFIDIEKTLEHVAEQPNV